MGRFGLKKFTIIFLFVTFISLSPQSVFGCPLEEWNKTLGGYSPDTGYFVQQTSDGGYIITGSTYSYGSGWGDGWLIKTNSNGTEEWNKTFGGMRYEEGNSVRQTGDKGYVVIGWTSSYGGWDAWLVKTSSNGTEDWNRTLGGSKADSGRSVQQTTDGGYIVTGWTYSHGAGGSDVWLVKTDLNGSEEWNKTFGGSDNDWAHSVQQTSDGGYIIAGSTYSNVSGWGDVFLIKTDINGIEEWNSTFGGLDNDWAHSVQQTSDGGYIVTGGTYSHGTGSPDLWLIKTDSNGNEKWNNSFGGEGYDEGWSVQQTTDGGYVIAGRTGSYGTECADVWFGSSCTDIWLILEFQR